MPAFASLSLVCSNDEDLEVEGGEESDERDALDYPNELEERAQSEMGAWDGFMEEDEVDGNCLIRDPIMAMVRCTSMTKNCTSHTKRVSIV